MADDGRVITAKLPDDLVSQLDDAADRIDRSKSWIVREAVQQWLAEEQHRDELTLEALRDADEGRPIDHDTIRVQADRLKRERREARTKSAA
jgi:predicted transcriptional regulator